MDKINEFRGDYFFLSNFYSCPIIYKGVSYSNAEAAYQAQKCINTKNGIEDKNKFKKLTGKEAKLLGKMVILRNDWNEIKETVMYEICKEKFSNPALKKMLLATEDKYIEEENTYGDKFWGTVNGVGKNKLGKILMKIREELREKEKSIAIMDKVETGITFGTFRDISNKYDEIWCIVRSLKKMPKVEGSIVRHVPELSPSSELFFKYLLWKKDGEWNKDKFKTAYVPEFLWQMTEAEAVKALNALYCAGKKRSILAVCYCPDMDLCHRSIVCGLLQGVGANIKEEKDYTMYYNLYKSIKELKKPLTACFTGRRAKSLYGYERAPYNKIVDVTKQICEELYSQGFKRFITGGAQGFDQLAFWAVNAIKKKHPDIQNIVYVPFKGQEERWAEEGVFSKKEYRLMLSLADEVKYLKPSIANYKDIVKALYDRNNAMVDDSDRVVALYSDDSWRKEKGGTADCMRYALSKDKTIIQFKYDLSDIQKMTVTQIMDNMIETI